MLKKISIGIAPIGWTNDGMPQLGGEISFEQCIKEIALAGYDGTEVGGKFPQSPEKLKQVLDLHNLAIASQWFGLSLCSTAYAEIEAFFQKQLDFLEKVGASRINVCELTKNICSSPCSMFGDNKPVATDEEWERLCKGLNELGKVAISRGFKLCYHHHMATVVQTLDETLRLMDNTDPKYVYLCYDTGHFAFSDEDAVEAARIFAPRIGHVHLKDIRPDRMKRAKKDGYDFCKAVLEGCFTVPGDGVVDFPGVFRELDRADYQGWLMVEAEQDPAKANPLEYAMKAIKYIKENAPLTK